MESLERKDASTVPEEPIKSEGVVPSPDTSERSNSAASPPPNCSICLGKLINTSFTDSCLHQFCFTCLLQWSKIKTECPLCKQTFKSIIHNVRSEEDYDQYHVQYTSQVAATLDVTADIHISGQWDVAVDVGIPARPFMYRTTMGANRRFGMLMNPEAVARREQIPSIAHQVSSEERRRRNANPIDYRRTVYRHGVWAASLPDAFGRFRESSAEYYRRHPSEVNRLIPWLNRELQVLLNNNRHHIAYVMGVITDNLTRYDIHSGEFRSTVRPYFDIHTDHFVHELSNYARTNFDLIGYDQAVSYIQSNRGLSSEYVHRAISPTLSTSSSSSNDSDVCVLDASFDLHRLSSVNLPSVGPHLIDMPGSSTVGQAFRIQLPYVAPDVLTISSTSSSSENECEVVGYVKPRHERTPEIIDLSSSDAEVNTTSHSTSNDNTPSEAQLNSSLKEEINLPSTSSSSNDCQISSAPNPSIPGTSSSSRRTRRRAEDCTSRTQAQLYEYKSLDTSSESNDSAESDSDYNPRGKSRRHTGKSSSNAASAGTSRRTSSKPAATTAAAAASAPAARKQLRTRSKRITSSSKKSSAVAQQQPRRLRAYSSSDDDSEGERDAGPSPAVSRGRKRYLSKSSNEDAPGFEKSSRKKKKKSKSKSKSKSSSSSSSLAKKKSKGKKRGQAAKAPPTPRSPVASPPLPSYMYSSSCSCDSEAGDKESRRPRKPSSSATTTTNGYSSEGPCSAKCSSTKSTSSAKAHSDLSEDYNTRSASSRRSSIASSYDNSPKNLEERLQIVGSGHCSSEEEEPEPPSRVGSSCSSDDVPLIHPKKRALAKLSAADAAAEKCSPTTTTTASSSSKSDCGSSSAPPTEHSSSSASSTASSSKSSGGRDRHRSHKKRKESKKRRRSRS